MGSSGSSLWVVGSNTHGQLGLPKQSHTPNQHKHSSPNAQSIPTIRAAEIPQCVESRDTATQVAAGETHTAALLDNGTILTWGSSSFGKLGHRIYNTNDLNEQESSNAYEQEVPQLVHFPPRLFGHTPLVFLQVSCGQAHTAAIASDGTVYTWGSNLNGRLGRETHHEVEERTPGRVQVSSGFSSISCGACHTAACSMNNGRCFTWGLGMSGRLGHGNERDQRVPVVVENLKSMQTHRCAAGGHHTLVMVSSSEQPLPTVYSFGGGSFGKLGQGTIMSSSVPLEIISLSPSALTAVEQTCQDKMWGRNSSSSNNSNNNSGGGGGGGGGEGETTTGILDWVVWISAGAQHCCAVTRLGAMYTWGQGNQGRLGHGNNDDVHVPRSISSFTTK